MGDTDATTNRENLEDRVADLEGAVRTLTLVVEDLQRLVRRAVNAILDHD